MKPVENCCRHAFSFLKSKAQSDENRNEQSRQSNHQEEEEEEEEAVDEEGRKVKGGKSDHRDRSHTYIQACTESS